MTASGGAVGSYNAQGIGFDSRWRHWNSSLTKSFRPQYGSEVDSSSNRNEYQGYFISVYMRQEPRADSSSNRNEYQGYFLRV